MARTMTSWWSGKPPALPPHEISNSVFTTLWQFLEDRFKSVVIFYVIWVTWNWRSCQRMVWVIVFGQKRGTTSTNFHQIPDSVVCISNYLCWESTWCNFCEWYPTAIPSFTIHMKQLSFFKEVTHAVEAKKTKSRDSSGVTYYSRLFSLADSSRGQHLHQWNSLWQYWGRHWWGGVEIAGPAGTDLSGWSIVLYNGSGGASYDTISLSGTIDNQHKLWRFADLVT